MTTEAITIEDVAQAIAIEVGPDLWDNLTPNEQADFRCAALSALSALRGPLDVLDATERFMRAAEQSIAVVPALPAAPIRLSRVGMLAGPTGEVNEYLDAEAADDLTEIVDGLWDTIIVAYGTLLTYIGAEATAATGAIIAQSNLDKLRGGVTKDHTGKVQKPADWVNPRPQLEAALTEHGWVAPGA